MSPMKSLVAVVAGLVVPAAVSAQTSVDWDMVGCTSSTTAALGVENCSKVIASGIAHKQLLARMFRGMNYLRLSAYRLAADDYEIVLKAAPNAEVGLYGHGLALLHLGQVARGRAEIARAIAISSSVVDDFAEDGIPAPAYLKRPKATKPL